MITDIEGSNGSKLPYSLEISPETNGILLNIIQDKKRIAKGKVVQLSDKKIMITYREKGEEINSKAYIMELNKHGHGEIVDIVTSELSNFGLYSFFGTFLLTLCGGMTLASGLSFYRSK